jgi:hypothetical protein
MSRAGPLDPVAAVILKWLPVLSLRADGTRFTRPSSPQAWNVNYGSCSALQDRPLSHPATMLPTAEPADTATGELMIHTSRVIQAVR